MKFILLTFLLYHIRLTSAKGAGVDPPVSCCLKVSNTKVPIGSISDYSIQKSPPCNIRAIRFHTIKKKTLCWGPDENWAKCAMKAIDEGKTMKPTIGTTLCRTSTSTRIPTTPIKTPGPETKTSTELRVRDYKRNFRRNSTEKTNKEELFTTRTEPMEHAQHSSSQITETFHVDKKQERKSTNPTKIINDLYENKYIYTKIHHFCLQEQEKYSYFSRQLNRVVIAEFRPKSCCLEVSKTNIPVGNLLDYYIQNSPLCHLSAIQFLTRRNITICSNPEDNWAKRAIKELDRIKTTKPPLGPPICITSTSTRIPTTPIKTPGPETKTSSRKVTSISTAPSTVTTFKTTGLQTKIRTSSTKPAKVSTGTSQSPLSSAKQCTEPNHSTETSHKPTGKDTEAPQTTFTSTTKDRTTMRKKPLLKIIQRKRGKSKKQLWKYQMKMGSQG
ncbi:mucin-5AC-like [Triplophysa rosa]|uniref:mucin-5AC-like n=1 Tax=Triplophysa rosa TaxID=992332 RepID=UPI002545F7D2|nr:mucin-5AC-like [Triplophysa rosa]